MGAISIWGRHPNSGLEEHLLEVEDISNAVKCDFRNDAPNQGGCINIQCSGYVRVYDGMCCALLSLSIFGKGKLRGKMTPS